MNERTHDPLDPALKAIVNERRQLIGLAYRLVGSLSEAEDVVQETYTRWYALSPAQREAIDSPGAWLTTVAGRICLDLLGSARARRERYVGEWLPEPLPGHVEWTTLRPPTGDPADRITLDESINMAFLVVLESLTPAERVAFVLHDVFRYPFAEVAEIVGRSPAACRQLATSARRRIRATRLVPAPIARQADLVKEFKKAWEAKDIEALIGLLDPDVKAASDGGGVVRAALHPFEGREEVASYLISVAHLTSGLDLVEREVNGRPGLVLQQAGQTVAVFAFHVAEDRIQRIWGMRNPEKLRPWADA
ncbi:RNA polymerase sigma factor SigJ [Amycolatopsis sp. TNS106]|uniref:RNA polymerase sigma factor SigJ n=1 Tax=Amycolatopsis sp. TNS106 TaxID=2861750 RepID=UPI001C58D195|nr:RNA polymerase sigma factor SigJ [Amycolatopsis sp. TNS106]QXV55867.1 RNA polymerase subunit sigma-24 [Amycolatopsis sp. TNS106]